MARTNVARMGKGTRTSRPLLADMLRYFGLDEGFTESERAGRKLVNPRLTEVFNSVNKSFRSLLSRSSFIGGPNNRWQLPGAEVGAKYTYDLYNSLQMSLRWRREKRDDFGVSFTISSVADHYEYVDKGVPSGKFRIPSYALLRFAIKRVSGWGHIPVSIADGNEVDYDSLAEYYVPIMEQDGESRHKKRTKVKASWALAQMRNACKKRGYMGLQLSKHILQYSEDALARQVGPGALFHDDELKLVFLPGLNK